MRLDVSFVRSATAFAALTALLLPSTGCFGSGVSANADPSEGGVGSEPEAGIDDPHSGERIATDPLAACTEGLSPREIEDAVAITFDFEVSAHEMVACGGLVFGIVGALVEGIAELVQDPTASTLPEGFTLDDEGTYFVAPAVFNDLRMEVRFHLGRDYSFGNEGDIVKENLFLMSSYLVDAQTEIHVDTSTWPVTIEAEITHAGPGPLVELLGLGADPPSPIVVTDEILTRAQAHLGDMKVDAIIFFADHPGVSTIEYDVESPQMLARSLLTGAAMDLAMVGADGWRNDLEQDLDVDVWTVEYADGGVGALDGDIDFTVRGGPFDFVSRFHYDGTGWPEIELACAP